MVHVWLINEDEKSYKELWHKDDRQLLTAVLSLKRKGKAWKILYDYLTDPEEQGMKLDLMLDEKLRKEYNDNREGGEPFIMTL